MTAVVGILNKRGIALAADSAVTRERKDQNKVTKNGNKLIRISDTLPISVMITNSSSLLSNPWEIIIRSYRKKSITVRHRTVEDCMHDFFGFVSDNNLFSDEKSFQNHIRNELMSMLSKFHFQIDDNMRAEDSSSRLCNPDGYGKVLKVLLKKYCKRTFEICPQFEDYTLDKFQKYSEKTVDEVFDCICYDDDDNINDNQKLFPKSMLHGMRKLIVEALYFTLISRSKDNVGSSKLIFSGFGAEQAYPSLISAVVNEGFDGRINYHTRPEEIICIDDEHPVAICPFAQEDIIYSVLRGIHLQYFHFFNEMQNDVYADFKRNVYNGKNKDTNYSKYEVFKYLEDVETDNYISRFMRQSNSLALKNQQQWEKVLKDCDLQSMAELVESLIDLTEVHRILHFEQESVGGPVDVAVISKDKGFVWLNRKSWYKHEDVNGQYGKLGI